MSYIKYVCEVRSLGNKTKDRLALRKSACETPRSLVGLWTPLKEHVIIDSLSNTS